jgi:hypothetical protein
MAGPMLPGSHQDPLQAHLHFLLFRQAELDYSRICLSTTSAERALRDIALGQCPWFLPLLGVQFNPGAYSSANF